MPAQSLFVAHPANDEQIKGLKAFVKTLNIKFEIATFENPCNK